MNTDTVTLTGSNTVPSSIDHRLAEIDAEQNRLTALNEERTRLLQERERLLREETEKKAAALAARRAEAILTLPAILEVGSMDEVVALILGTGTVKPTAKSPSSSKGHRYSAEVRAQVRAAMVAGTSVSQISRHYRIGEATLWIWKKAWGLTKGHTPVVRQLKSRQRQRAPKSRRKEPLGDTEKVRLLARLKEGKTPVSQLALEFRRSRARIYQFAHKHGVATPGVLDQAA